MADPVNLAWKEKHIILSFNWSLNVLKFGWILFCDCAMIMFMFATQCSFDVQTPGNTSPSATPVECPGIKKIGLRHTKSILFDMAPNIPC